MRKLISNRVAEKIQKKKMLKEKNRRKKNFWKMFGL